MDLPETSSDAITSQPNVNNPDLHVIQQALSSLNTGSPRSGLPPFPPFDPHQDRSTVGQRWRKWINRFKNLLISLREFDSKAGFTSYICWRSYEWNFQHLAGTGYEYDTAVAKLIAYFEPSSNTDMAIFEFREMKQEQGQTLNAFYVGWRKKHHFVNSMTKIGKLKRILYIKQQIPACVEKLYEKPWH